VQSNGFPHHVGCRAPANSQNSFWQWICAYSALLRPPFPVN
jgi:hypothetical protein